MQYAFKYLLLKLDKGSILYNFEVFFINKD